jgi:hypothetical protein
VLYECYFAVHECYDAVGTVFLEYGLRGMGVMVGGSYRRSINVLSPLGSKGVLTSAFADLIKHLWSDQYTYVSPISLRVCCPLCLLT